MNEIHPAASCGSCRTKNQLKDDERPEIAIMALISSQIARSINQTADYSLGSGCANLAETHIGIPYSVKNTQLSNNTMNRCGEGSFSDYDFSKTFY